MSGVRNSNAWILCSSKRFGGKRNLSGNSALEPPAVFQKTGESVFGALKSDSLVTKPTRFEPKVGYLRSL